jgi:hypothetical protein
VLADYGYRVSPHGEDREQQFSCDLHGDGSDSKPSARVYPSSNSWYCFACGRPRDAIQTCREKEGQDFWAAIKTLEARYHLPQLPPNAPSLAEEVQARLNTDFTLDETKERANRFLQIMTDEREKSLKVVLAFWEAFDKVLYEHDEGHITELQCKVALVSLIERGQACD